MRSSGILSGQNSSATPPSATVEYYFNPRSLSLSDGDPIDSYPGSAPATKNAAQPDVDKQPTFKVVSGKKFVRFDGAGDLLLLDLATVSNFSQLFVAKLNALNAENFLLSATSSENPSFDGGSPNTLKCYIDPIPQIHSGDIGDPTLRKKLYKIVRIGTVYTFWVNADLISTVDMTDGGAINFEAFGDYIIGGAPLNGDIGPLKVWSFDGITPPDLTADIADFIDPSTGYDIELAAFPVCTVVPVAPSGGLSSGGTLTADDLGIWTGTPNDDIYPPTYKWYQCDALGDNPVEIPGETASTYQTQVGDIGSTIRDGITKHNTFGDVEAISDATGLITI